MANEQALRQVKELVKAGQIEAARNLLHRMPGDPRAEKWLQQLNERYPPPDDVDDGFGRERLWESDSQDKRLLQAQQLLREERYREARWLLTEIQHNPQARQWLIELDELEGRQKADRQEAVIAEKMQSTPGWLQALGDFVRSASFRVGVGSIMMLAGAVLLVMWLTLPWIDGAGAFGGFDAFGSELTCSAAELNAGRYKCQQLGYVEPDVFLRGNTGFVAVRVIDRGLMILPFLSIVAAVTGWSYAAGRMDTFTSLSVLTFCGVMFGAVPFIWEALSYGEAENLWASITFGGPNIGRLFAEYLETTYATFPFKAVGVSTGLFVTVASGLALAELSGWLGVRRPSRLESPDASAAGFEASVFERGRRRGGR